MVGYGRVLWRKPAPFGRWHDHFLLALCSWGMALKICHFEFTFVNEDYVKTCINPQSIRETSPRLFTRVAGMSLFNKLMDGCMSEPGGIYALVCFFCFCFFSHYSSRPMVNKMSWFQVLCVLGSVSIKEEAEGSARWQCPWKTTLLAPSSDALCFRDGWQKLYTLKNVCIKGFFSRFAIFKLSRWGTTKGEEMKCKPLIKPATGGCWRVTTNQLHFFLLGYLSPQRHVNRTGNSRDSFSINTWYYVSLCLSP